MSTFSQAEQKQWKDQRSLLFDYVNKKHKKDWLSCNLCDIISETETRAKSKTRAKINKQHIAEIEVHVSDTDLDPKSVKQIAGALPGLPFNYIKISKQQPPQHGHNKSSRDTITVLEAKHESYGICIYDPREDPSKLVEALCHGCLQAHARAVFPQKLRAKTVDSINKAVNIPGHEFFVIHKDILHKTGRGKAKIQNDKIRALLASFVQTVYNAPITDEKQDWQESGMRALMGMQFLNRKQAKQIINSLEEYFQDLEPEIDTKSSIKQFQEARQALIFTSNVNRIIKLTSQIDDKGVRGFIKRWLEQFDINGILPVHQPMLTYRCSPNGKGEIALNDAQELGSSLARSLRLGEVSPMGERQIVNDLIFSIRRFNDMWSRLDKNEKKYIKPKLIQIIHSGK